MMDIYHYRLSTNVPLWWGMLIMGETIDVLGEGICGKSLYLPLNFTVNFKLKKFEKSILFLNCILTNMEIGRRIYRIILVKIYMSKVLFQKINQ